MNVSGLDGLNNHILVLVFESDNPPLPSGGASGKTRELTKKWLLQEDESYVPVRRRKLAHPFVSSLMKISNDKPVDRRLGVAQTWGIIAALSKQQKQLNVPHHQQSLGKIHLKKTVMTSMIP
jgi:hypothetical protein